MSNEVPDAGFILRHYMPTGRIGLVRLLHDSTACTYTEANSKVEEALNRKGDSNARILALSGYGNPVVKTTKYCAFWQATLLHWRPSTISGRHFFECEKLTHGVILSELTCIREAEYSHALKQAGHSDGTEVEDPVILSLIKLDE